MSTISTTIITFLNSNLFVGLATILTATVAYVIYKKKKNDEKVQVALVLLTEIREAEEKIEKVREKIFKEIIQDFPVILSTKSWPVYAPLFINKFDQDELQLLNLFYDCAESIEEFGKRNNNYFWITTEERAKSTVQSIAEFAKEAIKNGTSVTELESYVATKREIFSKLLDKQNAPYLPSKPIEEIKIILARTPKILTSTCGLKLKKLAKL